MTGAAGPNLGLTVGWVDHDDHWGDAMNASNLLADTMIMCAVESIGLTTAPTGVAGKRYVVGASATGAWAGKDFNIAVFYQSAWVFYPQRTGWRIYNKADNKLYIYNNAGNWVNEMSTGFSPFGGQSAWTTATAYTATAPASYVSINGSSYVCLVTHTSGTFATDLAAGKWGPVALSGAANTIYDFSVYALGFLPGGQHLYRLNLTRAVEAPANLAGSLGKCSVNPTASYAVDLKKNGTTFATATMSTGGVMSFTTVGGVAVDFAIGDYIDVYAQATSDATLQDLAMTLSLTRL